MRVFRQSAALLTGLALCLTAPAVQAMCAPAQAAGGKALIASDRAYFSDWYAICGAEADGGAGSCSLNTYIFDFSNTAAGPQQQLKIVWPSAQTEVPEIYFLNRSGRYEVEDRANATIDARYSINFGRGVGQTDRIPMEAAGQRAAIQPHLRDGRWLRMRTGEGAPVAEFSLVGFTAARAWMQAQRDAE